VPCGKILGGGRVARCGGWSRKFDGGEEGGERVALSGDERVVAGEFEEPSRVTLRQPGDERARFVGGAAERGVADEFDAVHVTGWEVAMNNRGRKGGLVDGRKLKLVPPSVDVGEIAADVALEASYGHLGALIVGAGDEDVAEADVVGALIGPAGRECPADGWSHRRGRRGVG